jgi:uncharacterized protein YqgC (DUF456 family)
MEFYEIALEIFCALLGVIGILGSVLPILPGPPVSYVGMLILYIWGVNTQDDLTSTVMTTWLIISIAVVVLDYIVPSYFTKMTGGSKAAAKASTVGMIIGILFFPPAGMIIGAFIGALIGEMFIEGKELKHSLKAALGSFLGFLFGTGLKLTASGVMMYYIIAAAI